MNCNVELEFGDLTFEEKEIITKRFNIQIIQKSIYAICAVYFSISFSLALRWNSETLNITNVYNEFNSQEYIPSSIINIVAVLIIGLYCYMNFEYRNLIEKSTSHHPEILIFLCLPLYIFILVGISLETIVDILNDKHYLIQIANISDILYCISLLILVIEIRNGYDSGEVWQLSLTNMMCILYCGLGVLYYVVLNIAKEQIIILKGIFENNSTEPSNIISNNSPGQVINILSPFIIFFML